MRLHKFYFWKPNLKFLALSLTLFFSNFLNVSVAAVSREEALSCTDIKIVFARGSGVAINSDRDFRPFSNAVREAFSKAEASWRPSVSFYELGSLVGGWSGFSYPAPGIGISTWERFATSFGAITSGGDAGAYGDSVYDGKMEAKVFITHYLNRCRDSKVVLAGYSQGAQVVSSLLRDLEPIRASEIFAAFTFGDPKLYLPEGNFDLYYRTTAACYKGKEAFSEYRAYVPDCTAKEGILGGFHPYQISDFDGTGKIKAYCQLHDVICSSYIDLSDLAYGHASYEEQGTYKRAAEDLFDMYFNVVKPEGPAKDVAIILDNTTRSEGLLRRFKAEALKLAYRTFDKGGKVSVYYYFVDKADGSVRLDSLCDGNCRSLRMISTELQYVFPTDLGRAEVTLPDVASVLKRTSWTSGADKSLVLFTDTRLESPEDEVVPREEVLRLAYLVDPVSLFFVGTEENVESFRELAEATEGGVYTLSPEDILDDSEDEKTMLSTDLLERTNPVFSANLAGQTVPKLSVLSADESSEKSLRISVDSEGAETFLVTVGELPLGFTTEKNFTLIDLDFSRDLSICVVPVSKVGFKGERKCLEFPAGTLGNSGGSSEASGTGRGEVVVPRAPNTGIPKGVSAANLPKTRK